MEPETARIAAHSRRQAMDWSLVLLSQGIESMIEYAEAEGAWSLLVSPTEQERAWAAIRQYRLENRRWPWRRDLFEQGFLFDWASVAWVLLLGLFYWLNDSRTDLLRLAGAMDSTAVVQGQWWRLFTAVWLHADVAHLAANASIGFVLLALAMGRYGTGVGLLASYLAGVGGNVAAWLLSHEAHHSLGASGMVMGSLGLLAAQSFWLWQKTPKAGKYILTGVCGGLMLFVLLGLTPGTDILAHAGGFFSGLLVGALLTTVPDLPQKTWANFLAGLTFTALVIWPWWLALSHCR